MTTLAKLRRDYHRKVGEQIVRVSGSGGKSYPNFADGNSRSSVLIANGIVDTLGFSRTDAPGISRQTSGTLFEKLTCEFLEVAFGSIQHLRPGRWEYKTTHTQISNFSQYQHLEILGDLVNQTPNLAAVLGHGYMVTPDIIISRLPITRNEINASEVFLDDTVATPLTPFLASDQLDSLPYLHASISCKWTIRSDRSQNTRTEALNLIRNRKGKLPHIVAVTAEPLPMRIASLALGTGDLDCVYHVALHELREVCNTIPRGEDQSEILETMIQGKRLFDIGDLPFDLAV